MPLLEWQCRRLLPPFTGTTQCRRRRLQVRPVVRQPGRREL